MQNASSIAWKKHTVNIVLWKGELASCNKTEQCNDNLPNTVGSLGAYVSVHGLGSGNAFEKRDSLYCREVAVRVKRLAFQAQRRSFNWLQVHTLE
jgi:hypothetical protein